MPPHSDLELDLTKKIVRACLQLPFSDQAGLLTVLKQFSAQAGGNLIGKSQVWQSYLKFRQKQLINLSPAQHEKLNRLLLKKSARTQSGVVPVAVLTQPFPCPGRCIFCPADVRMPKSYLLDEPGAQRAWRNRFDPFAQVWNRLLALYRMGHRINKVELIILGGTWSAYPVGYQIWFVKRCLQALNNFDLASPQPVSAGESGVELIDNQQPTIKASDYNRQIAELINRRQEIFRQQQVDWFELLREQNKNQDSPVRCVGLVIETRPDEIDEQEVLRLRRLGATKVQLGVQSLNNHVLQLNKRGHDNQVIRRAFAYLRQAGFKIMAHWMPNLYGSDPVQDRQDFARLFDDPGFRPDELKIYPCSLIPGTELMDYYQAGKWQPYTANELIDLLVDCYAATPDYCRISRMIRDIPSPYIVAGNKLTNLREAVEQEIKHRQLAIHEIRYREVKHQAVTRQKIHLVKYIYPTDTGVEVFWQLLNRQNRIVGFLRLCLPRATFVKELNQSAIIRELHIYGPALDWQEQSDTAQHQGWGRYLVGQAVEFARQSGYQRLSVISAIGTRGYYCKLGFGPPAVLYQHLTL